MSKIRIIVVEDEFVISEDIRAELESAGYEVLSVFDNAEDALPAILKLIPDLLVVDIRLAGNMDGVQLVETIEKSLNIPIIYITANSDTVTYERARTTRPSAFLVKPFSRENLLASVDLALYHFSSDITPQRIDRLPPLGSEPKPFTLHASLFIRANGKYRKVKQQDILFVEAAGSYVNIQTANERFTLSQNLTQFFKKASLPCLVRIHRSYVVNVERVDSFDESHVYVQTHNLPLSENYRPGFLAQVRML